MRVVDKPLLLITDIDSSLPVIVRGDVVRIRQIFINVLSNAVKYTDKGFIALSVSAESRTETSVVLKITVKDSGRGIKKEDLPNVFGEFVRVDAMANKNVEGTGLGLAITKHLCKAMGGDIVLDSEYGKGSIFTITIPQDIVDADSICHVKDAGSKNVLVYEARDLYAQSISQSLANLEIKHTVVSSFSKLNEVLDDTNSYVRREEGEIDSGYGSPKFDFIFVSSFFYENIRTMLEKKKLKSAIVVLAEAAAMVGGNVKSIAMPAWILPIANILNNESDDKLNGADSKIIDFVAPGTSVLIVDDVGTNLMVAEGLMTPYKMKIQTASGGSKAISLVKENKYDIIFMDHMMPEMDGIEAVTEIRKLPNGKDAVIVALTANAIIGVEEMFKQNGFNGLLVKPIEIIKLNEILKQWIPKHKRKKYEISLEKATQVVAKTALLSGAADISSVDKGILHNAIEAVEEVLNEVEHTSFSGIMLKGIDTQKGLANSGGKIEFYVKVLSAFYNEGLLYKDKIMDAIREDDGPLFTTYVHGLKSSLANIGAGVLSLDAAELEKAGKTQNWEYIDLKTEQFLEDFSEILDSIERVLINDAETNGNGTSMATDASATGKPADDILEAKIGIFTEAASNLNIDIMDRALEELKEHLTDRKNVEIFKQIEEAILTGDFAAVAFNAGKLTTMGG
jgi:CheY-like chemotaxis protein/HPt (histidine-containing phosphotransfer) domain-containing protein